VRYTYLLLFLGLGISGDAVLVPLVYSYSFGFISLTAIYLLAIFASTVSCSVWYYIGLKVSKERIYNLPFMRKNERHVEKLSALMDSRGLFILYLSNFVYATRVPVEILAGVHHMNYRNFLIVDALGTISWTTFLYALVFVVHLSFQSLSNTITKVSFSIAAIIVLLVIVNIFLSKYVKKSWYKE
jgi:membrane protein DedA with SNARE-associated domain